MSAAEPGKLSNARIRLSELAATPVENGFAAKLKQIARVDKAVEPSAPDLILGVMANADRKRMADAASKLADLNGNEAAARTIAREKVLKEFESTLLASTLESIMPKSQDSLLGGGPAEEIWKGQQVQFLSQAIAQRSPLGLIGMFGDAPRQAQVAGNLDVTANGHQFGRIRSFAYSSGIAEES
ncbi:MAG: hypothetical protein HC855_00115 [Rhizobiales bacterium]|nr:hypothetical protein [Hyphomicrobiales bacterium]